MSISTGSPRASGDVRVRFRAAGRTTQFDTTVDSESRRVRFREAIGADQARLGTGIATIIYFGNESTRAQESRLRAARNPADLELDRPTIRERRLRVNGTATATPAGPCGSASSGTDDELRGLQLQTPIEDGAFSIDHQLSACDRELRSYEIGVAP